MSSQALESDRENAEIFHGNEICKEKIQQTLKEFDLPNGLLPLEEVSEVGINRITGFVWVKQKSSSKHVFQTIDKTVEYDEEVTGFIQKRRLKKVKGVKVKELLIWVTLGDFSIEENDPEKIVIKTAIYGIPRTYPVSAFLLEEGEKN
ncbi:hypothetical protein ACHQM5_004470 [Ranunculus cassubicifolius]